MNNLNAKKTTFMLVGSNKNTIEKAVERINKKHNVSITKTDVLNIAIDVFLNDVITKENSIEKYLIQYNKL